MLRKAHLGPHLVAMAALLATLLWPVAARAAEPVPLLVVEPVFEASASGDPTPGIADVERVDTATGPRLQLVAVGRDDPRSRRVRAWAELEPVRVMRRLVAHARAVAREIGQDAPAPEDPLLICVPERFAARGPSYAYAVPSRAEDPATGRVVDAPGIVLLAPMRIAGIRLTADGLEEAGLAPAVLVHELFHVLHAETHGFEYLKLKALADPFARHDSPVVTDPVTALVEGLAEAGEAIMEARYPGQVYLAPAPTLPASVVEILEGVRRRRITRVEHNHYIFEQDSRIKDGRLDTARDLLRTEGVVASLTAALVPHLHPERGLEVLVETLVRRRPRSFEELVLALRDEVPAARVTIERILLEYTRYAVHTAAAARRYRRVYMAKKAYLAGEIDRDELAAEKARWAEWRQGQWQRVQAGEVRFMAAIVNPLPVRTEGGRRFDLNGSPERLLDGIEALLGELGLAPGELDPRQVTARLLVERRGLGGGFADAREAVELLPEPLAGALAEGAARGAAHREERIHSIALRLRGRRLEDRFVLEPDPRFLVEAPAEATSTVP